MDVLTLLDPARNLGIDGFEITNTFVDNINLKRLEHFGITLESMMKSKNYIVFVFA
jgi:hypothetical protein